MFEWPSKGAFGSCSFNMSHHSDTYRSTTHDQPPRWLVYIRTWTDRIHWLWSIILDLLKYKAFKVTTRTRLKLWNRMTVACLDWVASVIAASSSETLIVLKMIVEVVIHKVTHLWCNWGGVVSHVAPNGTILGAHFDILNNNSPELCCGSHVASIDLSHVWIFFFFQNQCEKIISKLIRWISSNQLMVGCKIIMPNANDHDISQRLCWFT